MLGLFIKLTVLDKADMFFLHSVQKTLTVKMKMFLLKRFWSFFSDAAHDAGPAVELELSDFPANW